ncbi:AraC family transcriptional regulator [Pseudomonas sp. gcc21]|uniref:AraC family transcriptional regulator n=1 Tax=Pseudomonas sp. gcc21 TaxID=2726989 RepID=UPI00145119AE|nr:AraC family transcriptional regulator [Pseudomonas sp. gcc21]QJD57865.1 AraC family transcriptional regulator [Pseudomonas sp. gcc21]
MTFRASFLIVRFMIRTDSIPSGFIETLRNYVRERNLPAPALMGQLDSGLELPSVSALQFCELLESVSQLDPVQALGIRLGLAAEPRQFGVVGYMVSSCGTLGQALARYDRYHALLQEGLTSRARLKDGVLHMRWTQAVANTPPATEFSLAVFVALCQALIGRPVTPVRAGLPFARPQDTNVYQALLGCPVDFDCKAIELALPAHLLALPVSSKDPYLLRLLEQQAQALLKQQPRFAGEQAGAFFSQVQEQIVESMKNGDVSAELVAAALGCSLRTFYRQLRSAGYSYRGLLAHTRHTLARQYLADPALAQTDVALLLGYSEQSSFIRAFRSWTGMTPGEYRGGLVRDVEAGGLGLDALPL